MYVHTYRDPKENKVLQDQPVVKDHRDIVDPREHRVTMAYLDLM